MVRTLPVIIALSIALGGAGSGAGDVSSEVRAGGHTAITCFDCWPED